MEVRTIALAAAVALTVVVPLQSLATTPRTQTYQYVLGADGFQFSASVGEDTAHVGRLRVDVQAGDQRVHVSVDDAHGQPVAATWRLHRTVFPGVVEKAFCGSATVPLDGAERIEVAVTDPAETWLLAPSCLPYQGTAGTVTMRFT